MDEGGDVTALGEGAEQHAVRQRRVRWIEPRVQHERDAPDATPALHFDESVGLALRRPLLHRLAAACGEDGEQVDRLVGHGGPVPLCQCSERAAADVGPQRQKAEDVLDGGARCGFGHDVILG